MILTGTAVDTTVQTTYIKYIDPPLEDEMVRIKHTRESQTRADPFEYLPLEITSLIVELLDPPDTERVRRVCKSWKDLSEALNGYKTVARHCPKAMQQMSAKSKMPNLCFRQWLCFEQNLKAGLAQDVVLFNETMTWDIRNHLLVAGHRCGGIRIMPLRQSSTKISGLFNLNTLLWPHQLAEIVLSHTPPAEDGDMIIQFISDERRYIAKLTVTGTVVWLTATDWSTLAIGLEHVYVLTPRDWESDCKVLITDLKTGSQISSFPIPPLISTPESYGQLKSVLSSDEKFVLVKSTNHVLGIYDTIRRKITDIKGTPAQSSGPCSECSIIPDPSSSDFFGTFRYDQKPCVIYKYIHGTLTHTFTLVHFRSFEYEPWAWAPNYNYDIARNLVFEDFMYEHGLQAFTVRSLRRVPFTGPDAFKDTQKTITVVEKDTGSKRKVTLPVDGFPADDWLNPAFFGIHDGYLVYYSDFMRLLVVFDFWPAWGPHNPGLPAI